METLKEIVFAGLYNHREKTFVIAKTTSGFAIQSYRAEGESLAEINSTKPVKWKTEKKNDKGKWTIYKLAKEYSVIVCSGHVYKTYVISKFFGEIEDNLRGIVEWENKETSALKKDFTSSFESSLTKYQTQANADVLTQALKQSEKVMGLAETNLSKAIRQNQDLDTLQAKTTDLVTHAIDFEKKTGQIKNHTYWELWKTRVYIGTATVGLGGLVYYKFFI